MYIFSIAIFILNVKKCMLNGGLVAVFSLGKSLYPKMVLIKTTCPQVIMSYKKGRLFECGEKISLFLRGYFTKLFPQFPSTHFFKRVTHAEKICTHFNKKISQDSSTKTQL